MNRLLKIAIVFCALPLVLFGQKPSVQLEVDPKVIATNDVFSITIRTSVNGEIDIELPDEYVQGYNVMNGMEQDVDYTTGKIVSFYYVSQTGTFRKPGNYKIGPAVVKKGGKVYKSVTVNLQVNATSNSVTNDPELSAKQLRQPAFGIIETSKKKIYAGEPLVVNAKVYSRFDPTHMEGYKPYVVPGALEKHDIDGSSRIVVNEEYIKRALYYSFEHDRKVVFPEETGKISIEPFKLMLLRGLDGIPITAGNKTIEVVSLPKNAPKSFTGGVGQFTISRKINKTELTQGDVFDVELVISGSGNLHALREPKLVLPEGFKLYGDPSIKEDIQFNRKGAEGKIMIQYHVKAMESGSLRLPATTFAFFDPEKEKYCLLKTNEDLFQIISNPAFDKQNEIVASSAKPTHIDNQTVTNGFPKKSSNDGSNWSALLLVGAPLSLAFIGGLLWWGKQRSPKEDKQILPTYIDREKAETEKNKALTLYQSAQQKSAIQHIKKALTYSAIRYLKLSDESLSSLEVRTTWKEQHPNDTLLSDFEKQLTTCDIFLYSGWNEGTSGVEFMNESIELIDKLNR